MRQADRAADPDIVSDIPARLDALPWSTWHWRVVLALGITWVLDGVEVTIVGTLGGVLQRPDTLGLSPIQIGWSASAYIAGAVAGALGFGYLADRYGRRRLFLVTLAVYLGATLASALSFDFVSFCAFRMLTGLGIGGEYAAINSAIDELMPARVRGRVDLAINGSFWIGAALGAGLSLVLLDPQLIEPAIGWRLVFAMGAIIGVAIIVVRRHLPESPRWLLIRGRADEAQAVVDGIVAQAMRGRDAAPPDDDRRLHIALRPHCGWAEIARILLLRDTRRSVLGLMLMVSQAFFYNAIFFTYALVLTRFYGIAEHTVGAYMIPFAAGNFLGPLLLGRLFDTWGRRAMIATTYTLAAVGLLATGYGFTQGWLSATEQTLCWAVAFFFASAAASSAYLTVSEIFPLEMRGVAISIFYAIGTGAGGFIAPALFGMLIESASREAVFAGYTFGAALMLAAAVTALVCGVAAERKPLEQVAPPLSARASGAGSGTESA